MYNASFGVVWCDTSIAPVVVGFRVLYESDSCVRNGFATYAILQLQLYCKL